MARAASRGRGAAPDRTGEGLCGECRAPQTSHPCRLFPRYIENALELLDAPSEWFYDPAAGTLYFFNNGTGAPTADTLFEVPALLTLLRVNASQESPVRNLTISGIGFKDSAPSFMEPHAVPSGGDWALERIAALFFEGTESLVVSNLDGVGVKAPNAPRTPAPLIILGTQLHGVSSGGQWSHAVGLCTRCDAS